jgi:divalent metal cation (Fe/Co/Zn/Cd) transporter
VSGGQPPTSMGGPSADRERLVRRGLVLSYGTALYNSLEALIAIGAGLVAGSVALVAESRQTLICTYLSAILLGGLLINAVAGWWWADPVAALAMVPFIAREGLEELRGRDACRDHCG